MAIFVIVYYDVLENKMFLSFIFIKNYFKKSFFIHTKFEKDIPSGFW